MSAEELETRRPSQAPRGAEEDFRALVENLADPVVIVDRAGRICFTNPQAERTLRNGLKAQLEKRLRATARPPAVSQARFRLDTGWDVTLRIRLSKIEWMGESALLASLKDITPYVAAVQHLGGEVVESRKGEERSKAQSARLAANLEELAADKVRLEKQLQGALGRLCDQEQERERIERDLAEARQAAAGSQERCEKGTADRARLTAELQQLRQEILEARRAQEEAGERCEQLQGRLKELTEAPAPPNGLRSAWGDRPADGPDSPEDSAQDLWGVIPGAGRGYLKHFGLDEMPFSTTPDPRFFYPSAQHQQALACLLGAVEQRRGFALITGEVGAGKSMLCRAAMERLGPNADVAMIVHTSLNARQFLYSVCTELQLPANGKSKAELSGAIRNFLIEREKSPRNAVLLVDEAQDLLSDALGEIGLLGDLQTADRKSLQVVLIGQPELRELMGRPELGALNRRIPVKFHLGSLSTEEAFKYIDHRLRVAGASDAGLFEEAAKREVVRAAGGAPRVINVLCDQALLLAFLSGEKTVSPASVRRAVSEREGYYMDAPPAIQSAGSLTLL